MFCFTIFSEKLHIAKISEMIKLKNIFFSLFPTICNVDFCKNMNPMNIYDKNNEHIF